MPPSQNR